MSFSNHQNILLYQGWVCSCEAGWEGPYCSKNIDDCALDPCKNNAVCEDLLRDFKCHCPDTWTGDTCEEDVDECSSNPCVDGGTCVNLMGSFECLCEDEFCGQTCSLTNPCLEVSRNSSIQFLSNFYVIAGQSLSSVLFLCTF